MYFLVLVNWKRSAFKRIFSSKIIFYVNFYLLLINILLVPCLKLQEILDYDFKFINNTHMEELVLY